MGCRTIIAITIVFICNGCNQQKQSRKINNQPILETDYENQLTDNVINDFVVNFNYSDSLDYIDAIEIGLKEKWSKIYLYDNYKSTVFGLYRNGKCLHIFDNKNNFIYYTVFNSWIMKADINTGEIIDSLNADRFYFLANKYSGSKMYIKRENIILKMKNNVVLLSLDLDELYNFKEVYSVDKKLQQYKSDIYINSIEINNLKNNEIELKINYWYPDMIVFDTDSTKRVEHYTFRDTLGNVPKKCLSKK